MSFVRILDECRLQKISLLDWTLHKESSISGLNSSKIYHRLLDLWKIMLKAIDRGLTAEGILPGKLGVYRRAKKSLDRFESFDNPLQKSFTCNG